MSQSKPPPENFVGVRTSSMDEVMINFLVRPLLPLVPPKVTPNQITMVTPVFTTLCFVFAAMAPGEGDRDLALIYRLLSALFCLGSMVSDHLDGLHARTSGQSSKLGEILDHWVDSYSVTLLVLSLPVSLGATGPVAIVAVTTGAQVYHTQLLLYRSTGKFIYPPTGGAASAVLLAAALAGIALILRLVPEDFAYLEYFQWAVLLAMISGNLRNMRFYFSRLKSLRGAALLFLLAYLMVAAMLLLKLVHFWPVAALWIAISFRVSGSLVLHTVTKQAHRGFDPVLLFLLALTLGSAVIVPSPAMTMAVPVLLCAATILYVIVSNFVDFKRLTSRL